MNEAEATNVRLVVLDVDGVMTDGRLYIDWHGHETKAFHTRDGFGIRMAREAGLKVAVLSARTAGAVDHRVRDLKIDYVMQGVDHKGEGVERLARAADLRLDEMAYLGDDILDIAAMKRVAYPMAVADAADETKAEAAYVTRYPGGHGAVRDAMEHILQTQGSWWPLVEKYANR